jgi:hypothetical protein
LYVFGKRFLFVVSLLLRLGGVGGGGYLYDYVKRGGQLVFPAHN